MQTFWWVNNNDHCRVEDSDGEQIADFYSKEEAEVAVKEHNAKFMPHALPVNPKDIAGSKKIGLGTVCPVAIAHESCAMLDGELKYGPRSWRKDKIVARRYVDAAMRHLNAWAEGEETAPDSGVHHLGHARACLGILLDAQETGNLIDDRVPGVYPAVAERLNGWVATRVARVTPSSGAPHVDPLTAVDR